MGTKSKKGGISRIMKRFEKLYGVSLTGKKLRQMVWMLIGLEAVFAFSYLGYIELPDVSTTTLHVLVIVGAMVLGWQGSVPVACVFVATSMWVGSYSDGQLDRMFSPFVSGNPLGSLALAGARVLFALGSAGLYGLYFRKPRKHPYLGIGAVAVACTFLHGLCILAAFPVAFPGIRETLMEDLFSYPMFRDWMSYAVAVAGCWGTHWVLSQKKIQKYLSVLCEDPDPVQENGVSRLLVWAKAGALITGTLCILYLRKVILGELELRGCPLVGTVNRNITAFLTQEFIAFMGLFGIVGIIIQWIYEYYTVLRIKMNRKLLEQSVKISIDPLTGVFSRFAYHEAMEQTPTPLPEDFTVFLMDINGLKVTNDTLGHEAGDELIRGAAACITRALEDKGRTYRIGGDEFVVFATLSPAQTQAFLTALNRAVTTWTGTKVPHLSLSVGRAAAKDFPGRSVEELTKEADRAMYIEKQAYYQKKNK